MSEIPEHIWEAARSLRGAVLWESNSSVEHIAQALLAAEKRGKEVERERCAGVVDTYLETLAEGLMTDAGLSKADRTAMKHQVTALELANEAIRRGN